MTRPTWEGIKAKIERGEQPNAEERRYALAVCDKVFAEGLRQGRHTGDPDLLAAAKEGRRMLRFLGAFERVPHTRRRR